MKNYKLPIDQLVSLDDFYISFSHLEFKSRFIRLRIVVKINGKTSHFDLSELEPLHLAHSIVYHIIDTYVIRKSLYERLFVTSVNKNVFAGILRKISINKSNPIVKYVRRSLRRYLQDHLLDNSAQHAFAIARARGLNIEQSLQIKRVAYDSIPIIIAR